ncbi:DapH/DapD/GlmU-related protein [Mesonia sp.]|uniref:DapH/DapD/GlmU-related protein n=1 Tax=Mesonia sp. TaxID=1960830 RepID=UPI00175ACFC4|nr:DapH/DapD/GlmU-related protein [Mesonia sp.]HIB35968.1 hypothetical protein [Mesonia sp.]
MFYRIKHKCWEYFLNKVESSLANRKKKSIDFFKEQIFNQLQSVGFNCRLNGDNWVFKDPRKIILGNNVHIGNNFYCAGAGGVTIGDNAHISRNVTIYSVNHNYEGNLLPYDLSTKYKPVFIGKNVWIGMNVSIVPGVKIGDGAIIGMGTIVNRNVEANEIVGTPKINHLKYRNNDHYNILNQNKMFGSKSGVALNHEQILKFKKSYSDCRNKPVIFVLGTGRSGSKSIVNILNQNPACKAFHEDILQLTRISTKIAEHKDNHQFYLQELKSIFETKIWQASDDQILIHSDQRLWNLIPFLKEYFPNSKFIHLEREKYSCIKSMYTRRWYQDNEYPDYIQHDWAKYRLQADRIGEVNEKLWRDFSSLQRCTWYYTYINNTIKSELKKLNPERVYHLQLEKLNDELEHLSNFISNDNFSYQPLKSNSVRGIDKEIYRSVKIDDLKAEIDSTQEILKSVS